MWSLRHILMTCDPHCHILLMSCVLNIPFTVICSSPSHTPLTSCFPHYLTILKLTLTLTLLITFYWCVPHCHSLLISCVPCHSTDVSLMITHPSCHCLLISTDILCPLSFYWHKPLWHLVSIIVTLFWCALHFHTADITCPSKYSFKNLKNLPKFTPCRLLEFCSSQT